MRNNSSPYINDNGRPSSKAITLVVSLGIAFSAVVIGPALFASATTTPDAAATMAQDTSAAADNSPVVDTSATNQTPVADENLDAPIAAVAQEPAPQTGETPPPRGDHHDGDHHDGDHDRPGHDHHHDEDHDH